MRKLKRAGLSEYRKLWCLVWIGMLLFLSTGLPAVANRKNRSYHLAYSGRLIEAPLYAAVHKGFFKAEGLTVSLIKADLSSVKALLDSGKVEGFAADYRIFKALDSGWPLKLVAGLHGGCIRIIAPHDSGIKEIGDLRYKVIGVEGEGDGPMVIAARQLRNHGIDPLSQITWKTLRRSELETTLRTGRIDAASIWEPGKSTPANRQPVARVIFSTAGSHAGPHGHGEARHFYAGFIGLSERLIKEQPQAAVALTRAWLRAADWVGKNQADAFRLASDNHYVQNEPEATINDGVQWIPGVRYVKEDILSYIEEQERLGILSGDIDARKVADRIFAPIIPDLKAH